MRKAGSGKGTTLKTEPFDGQQVLRIFSAKIRYGSVTPDTQVGAAGMRENRLKIHAHSSLGERALFYMKGDLSMEKYNIISGLKLAEGAKITIVIQNDFGLDYVVKMRFIECNPLPHYYNCPEAQIGAEIIGVPQKKRSAYRYTIDYLTPFIIYDGWRDIDLESVLFEKEERGDVTISTSRYFSFDRQKYIKISERYSDGILASSF